MTITTNRKMQEALRALIANDSYATTFQTMAQYRTALLKHVDGLLDDPRPMSQAHPGSGTPSMADYDNTAQQYAALAHRAEPEGEAPQAEELVHALRQAERLLRAAGFAMTGTASSQIVAAIAAHAAHQAAAPGALTNAQIAAGAGVLGNDGKPVGRNTAVMVFDAMQLTAAPSAPETPEAPTDDEIIAALHACAIDTRPSKYGFPERQVDATNVPGIRAVYMKLATRAAQRDDGQGEQG